ncbi:AsmA family protein [Myroides sp. LJL119]
MKKKVLLSIIAVIGVIVVLLFTAPFLFHNKIQDLVKTTINKNLNARVDFKQVDLSLFRSFPKANISIKDFTVINNEPFSGDTLAFVKQINLKLSIYELFKSNHQMDIESIELDSGKLNLVVDSQGVSNYDIALKDSSSKQDHKDQSGDTTDFLVNLSSYQIKGFDLHYTDLGSKIQIDLRDFYHKGRARVNSNTNKIDLDTQSKALVGFSLDSVSYLKALPLELQAIIAMDLQDMKFSFKQNQALINQLPLEFDGFVQIKDTYQDYDLVFSTPSSDFKNFLALIPTLYSEDLQKVSTRGEFQVNGEFKGKLDQQSIPVFDIGIKSKDAYFKYQDLPMAVEHIDLDITLANTTTKMQDTFLAINSLEFQIGKDTFQANALLRNISENPTLQATVNGIINLANLSKVYPIKMQKSLKGILSANLSIDLDKESVDKLRYQNIKSSGNISLTDFNYSDSSLQEAIQIQMAALSFSSKFISLDSFVSKIGQSDIKAKGRVDNLYGFLFSKQILKGNFSVNSNYFVVSDFLQSTTNSGVNPTQGQVKQQDSSSTNALQIPAFLDCSLTIQANQVVYDQLDLFNVKGTMLLNQQSIDLQNIRANLLDGSIDLKGNVQAKDPAANFHVDLNLNNLDIQKSFSQIELLKTIAPISDIVSGRISAKAQLQGNLQSESLDIDMQTLQGELQATLNKVDITPSKSKMLSLIDNTLGFVNFKDVNLNQKQILVNIDKGNIVFKPLDFQVSNMPVTFKGAHGLDQNMNYKLDFLVPSSLLGPEVSVALGKLSTTEQSNFSHIPVEVGITGNFSSPKISTDLQTVVSRLATDLLEAQAKNLANKGKDALKDLLNSASTTKQDTTNQSSNSNQGVNKIQQGLKDIFSKSKHSPDSEQQQKP